MFELLTFPWGLSFPSFLPYLPFSSFLLSFGLAFKSFHAGEMIDIHPFGFVLIVKTWLLHWILGYIKNFVMCSEIWILWYCTQSFPFQNMFSCSYVCILHMKFWNKHFFSSMLKEEKSVDAFIGYALSKQFNLSIINTIATYSFGIWEHSVSNYSIISLYFSGMICYFFSIILLCVLLTLKNFMEFVFINITFSMIFSN